MKLVYSKWNFNTSKFKEASHLPKTCLKDVSGVTRKTDQVEDFMEQKELCKKYHFKNFNSASVTVFK